MQNGGIAPPVLLVPERDIFEKLNTPLERIIDATIYFQREKCSTCCVFSSRNKFRFNTPNATSNRQSPLPYATKPTLYRIVQSGAHCSICSIVRNLKLARFAFRLLVFFGNYLFQAFAATTTHDFDELLLNFIQHPSCGMPWLAGLTY